jgi:hypothetical protein
MTDDTRLKLAFGRRTYPDTAQAVWGARLIYPNDLLHDRQDLAARSDEAKMALIAWLNGPGMGDGAIAKMRTNLTIPSHFGLSQSSNEEAVIYEDDEGIIVGSPQGSFGYVYVAGWLKEQA